ncbi:MFS transporter [Erwinia sp. INIA-01]|uniref:MFS transporter n=1 Tax=Erwinia sp. INIA01 TaxID=2991500 RepID=UPI002225B310|nr:MFS transporter [Erwinia sp. INIA01]MCW1876354.1 MFS transporter [Erwinia sp. INIA01]
MALVIALVQFANALEYMVFNPLFAFMAIDFAVPVSYSGYVSGLYTAGAVISGFSAFYWLGRVNKKRFLMLNMALLGTLTVMATLTQSFGVLLILRFLAGMLGGTTMGVAIGLLINQTPPDMRGKMLATVIAAFSMVSIAGMPLILLICTHFGWHLSLNAIGLLCLLAIPLVTLFVPAETSIGYAPAPLTLSKNTLLFASANALVQFSPMLIIPILVPLLTRQMGLALPLLPWVFLAGGIAGLLATKITGKLLVHFNTRQLAVSSTLIFLLSLGMAASGSPLSGLFIVLFLAASYSRLVVSSAVTISYPSEGQRAQFVALQTSLMHLATTVAFFLVPLLLGEDGAAWHLERLLIIAAVAALLFPIFIVMLQRNQRINHP